MTDYIQLVFSLSPCSEDVTDLLAAFLADAGFESFVPSRTSLTAYVREQDYNPEAVDQVLADFPMEVRATYTTELVKGRDWNSEWEKNYFQPIVVADKCVIHSTFHKDVPSATYDIVIDPRMAFGTGHHATTSMMLEYLLSLPMEGKRVIDMGTGTGILSILCEKLGAARIDAIEIDRGAWENACEHMTLNHTPKTNVILGDARALELVGEADLVLANINRNIILADFPNYASRLKGGGTMLLSGFYEQDIPLIEARAASFGFSLMETKQQGDWVALRLEKA